MVYGFAKRSAILWFFVAAVLCPALEVTQGELEDVMHLGRAIHHVQPYLEEGQYLEYGLGILRASRQYDIDPHLLIAIANRETSFRDNLPEGKAGEIGICQIRKAWLQNAVFRKEFRRASMRELRRSSKNFLYAAWILRHLKDVGRKGALPYWSYYNAMKFEPRLRYFITVNKTLVAIKRFEARRLASETTRRRRSTSISFLEPVAPKALSSWQKPKQSLGDSRSKEMHDSNMVAAAAELGAPERWVSVKE